MFGFFKRASRDPVSPDVVVEKPSFEARFGEAKVRANAVFDTHEQEIKSLLLASDSGSGDALVAACREYEEAIGGLKQDEQAHLDTRDLSDPDGVGVAEDMIAFYDEHLARVAGIREHAEDRFGLNGNWEAIKQQAVALAGENGSGKNLPPGEYRFALANVRVVVAAARANSVSKDILADTLRMVDLEIARLDAAAAEKLSADIAGRKS